MSNGKQILFLGSIIVIITAFAALSGCASLPCRDELGNVVACGSGVTPDNGMINPDAGVTPDNGMEEPDASTPYDDFTVVIEGLIYEASVGEVSNVNVIGEQADDVLLASCDITSRPARNGWQPFSCTLQLAEGDLFLVRYNSPGHANYAVVTNYGMTSYAFNDAEFLVAEIKDGGSVWNYDNYHRVKVDATYRDLIVTPESRSTPTNDNTARLCF